MSLIHAVIAACRRRVSLVDEAQDRVTYDQPARPFRTQNQMVGKARSYGAISTLDCVCFIIIVVVVVNSILYFLVREYGFFITLGSFRYFHFKEMKYI